MNTIVLGMAHRGRLNALINVLGKPAQELFQEFEGVVLNKELSGDVKYHLGYSANIKTKSGNVVHMVLEYNPSHLEIVGPVINGSTRARSMRMNKQKIKDKVLPIIVHGDSAFAGQGVVMELLNMSQLRGYNTEGTIHIVINNQVGFTTSNTEDTRSTLYCTDVAKMLPAPILHVNGEDPVAVVKAAKLAFEYRAKFKRDIVIDLVCYRRHGHNEADEPSLTQPMMYQKVKAMRVLREKYADELIAEGLVTKPQVDAFISEYRDLLDTGASVVETVLDFPRDKAGWDKYKSKVESQKCKTAISKEEFLLLTKALEALPEGFKLHPVVQKVMDERQNMTLGNTPLNWGYAEVLAYAALLHEGYSVRLSGQDVGRGTFAHRHAVLHDYNNGRAYKPLEKFTKESRNAFESIDSLLSEEAVLAFEYGYSASSPNTLVLWEAQFGDFANGAQVVVDQFISSSEQKWNRLCGLVMLLPHGQEGQGPEHSSARLERYLQLCAQDNMQVCMPSTPAQIFHLLRLQMLGKTRRPLIVMTPKSLLRHKLAVSNLEELINGEFLPVIDEIDALDKKAVERIVLCSGKVYYELLQKRRDLNLKKVAIIRVERLYPFPESEIERLLKQYSFAKSIVWCQEEPKNQGSFTFIEPLLQSLLSDKMHLVYVGRDAQASPAVGSASVYQKQQELIINNSLEG